MELSLKFISFFCRTGEFLFEFEVVDTQSDPIWKLGVNGLLSKSAKLEDSLNILVDNNVSEFK